MYSSRSGSDFWATVIHDNLLISRESVMKALTNVKKRLAATSPVQLADFDQWLSCQLYDLDRKEFFDSPVIDKDGNIFPQTDDHFLYARCACVLSGRAAFASVLKGRLSFTEFTSIYMQSAEMLLDVAGEVCTETFGVDIVRRNSPRLAAGSNQKYWPLGDETQGGS
jgi:hypothetical protein